MLSLTHLPSSLESCHQDPSYKLHKCYHYTSTGLAEKRCAVLNGKTCFALGCSCAQPVRMQAEAVAAGNGA